MKFPQNFRKYSRNLYKNVGDVSRILIALLILVFFLFLLISNLFESIEINDNRVLGNSTQDSLDVNKLLNEAALNISQQNFKEASRKLAIVLEFEPNNVYAASMNHKVAQQIEEVQAEIAQTLQITRIQPNWKEAWLKLAGLYDKAGETQLAKEARERASSLKTS